MSTSTADLGIISLTDRQTREQLAEYVRQVEDLGYGSIWLPELLGREPFSTAGWLLAQTTRLVVATGIGNVYARGALTAAQSAHTLAELSNGRFAMGLGVSHPQTAEMRGEEWIAPGRKMRSYLETIRATEVQSVAPERAAPIYVAAHGPVLLRVVAGLADGALGYLMPTAHGESAKAILGAKPLLTVLPFCLDQDRARALAAGSKGLAMYMALPAYQSAWGRFGLDASDPQRLVDSIGAFGDLDHVRRRIQDFLDAGTDRIILSPFHGDRARPGGPLTRLEALEHIAGDV